MPTFSITWRQPGMHVRMIIIILIYVDTWYFAPHMTMPVVLGSLLGGLLTAEPTHALPARKTPESDI